MHLDSKRARVAELFAVPTVALIVILASLPFVGENPIAYQGLIWVANVLMLITVWLGLRLRGQGWDHFGLSLRFGGARTVLRALLLSVVFGLIHFSWGPIGMVETGFMGLALGMAYPLLKRNLWVVILAHAYMDTILMLQMYFGAAQALAYPSLLIPTITASRYSTQTADTEVSPAARRVSRS